MKVNFYATFRPIVGGKTVLVAMPDGATVQQLVDQVIDDFPALGPELYDSEGKLFPHVHVFVNGRDAPYLPCAMETVLQESDTVDIFPPVGGG